MSVAKMRCRKWVTVTTTILVNMYRQVSSFGDCHQIGEFVYTGCTWPVKMRCGKREVGSGNKSRSSEFCYRKDRPIVTILKMPFLHTN
jgi:hypothetical protein